MNRYSLTSRRVAAAWVPKLYLWSIAMTSTDGLTFPSRSTIRSLPGNAFDEYYSTIAPAPSKCSKVRKRASSIVRL